MSGDQDGSPRGGAGSGEVIQGNPARRGGLVLEQADEGVQVRSEEILASEMRDDSLLDLVAVTEGLDEAEVLVTAVGGFDGAEEQGGRLLRHYNKRVNGLKSSDNRASALKSVSLHS